MAVTGWQVRTYYQNVHHKAQESQSKIDGKTLIKEGRSRMIGFPVIDPAEMETPTSRYAPTPNNTPDRQMRFCFPRPARINLMEDQIDEDEHFWQANSQHVITAAAASNREQVRRFVVAATGGAMETTEDTHGTPGTIVALPAAQTIPANSQPLTKAKITRARTTLDKAVGGDRMMWGPYYFLYDPDDFRSIAPEDSLVRLDFVTQRALMQGEVVQGLMGFTWVPTSQLEVSGNIRKNIAWARTAMGCGRNKGVKLRAGERADLSYTEQVFREEKYNYVRIDDKGVVVVEVDTTQIPA